METAQKSITAAPAGAARNPSGRSTPTALGRRDQTAAASALTRQQREPLLNAAAAGMVPARAPKKVEDPLKVWWPHINRKLKEGFSVRQIQTMLCSPQIGLNVSARALQRAITEHKSARGVEAGARKTQEV